MLVDCMACVIVMNESDTVGTEGSPMLSVARAERAPSRNRNQSDMVWPAESTSETLAPGRTFIPPINALVIVVVNAGVHLVRSAPGLPGTVPFFSPLFEAFSSIVPETLAGGVVV